MSSASILVVDDEQSIRHFAGKSLKDEGYHVRTAGTGEEAMTAFNEETPDVVVLDVKLPDANGLDLLSQMKDMAPDTAVIMITAFDETETAVKAMSEGAFYYLKKPLELAELNALVGRAIEKLRLTREVEHLRQSSMAEEGSIRCLSAKMESVYETVESVARGETTSVLIEGESGTGKEIIARYIHKLSARESKPFLEINCSAIPKDLLESELFGHEKGAFTDARAQKQGLLELAHGGTLFLDEIGEMSLQLQVKLLRVLERMIFKRVGGVKDLSVSVRIVSATNQDLERLMRAGQFREDLYYRLKVVPIYVPPLRERREDILPLALHFMERFNQAFKKQFRGFSEPAERMLLEYGWPGNVRELRNLMERTVLIEPGEEIQPQHLQLGSRPRSRRESITLGSALDDLLQAPGVPEGGIPFEQLVDEVQKALIVKACQAADWNQSRAAEILNLNRDKLRYRMKQFDLKDGESASHVGHG